MKTSPRRGWCIGWRYCSSAESARWPSTQSSSTEPISEPSPGNLSPRSLCGSGSRPILTETQPTALASIRLCGGYNFHSTSILQGRSQAKAAQSPQRKKYKTNTTYSVYNIHNCTLTCTRSFSGGEKPWMSYDATNPPIWHLSTDAVIDRFATTAARRLNFLIWTYTCTSVHCTVQ